MIVFKAYLGQAVSLNSIRSLQQRGELVSSDSWSEVNLTYEKYDSEIIKRVWNKITKAPDGLVDLSKVPTDGTWGFLYE